MKRFYELGYHIVATQGTAEILEKAGLPVKRVNKLREGSPNILDWIRQGKADLVVNTWTRGRTPERDGFRIRREAVERGVACLTSLDTVQALLETLESIQFMRNRSKSRISPECWCKGGRGGTMEIRESYFLALDVPDEKQADRCFPFGTRANGRRSKWGISCFSPRDPNGWRNAKRPAIPFFWI